MIAVELEKNFGTNKPIFISEIKALFPQYASSYIYQLLREAIKRGEIVRYDESVYFVPKINMFGNAFISPDDIVYKKYIRNGDDVQGAFIGWTFLNGAGATRQMPHVREIATNKEKLRVRIVNFDGCRFILRKPRVKINKKNQQLIALMETAAQFRLGEESSEALVEFARENKIYSKDILKYSGYYPAQTLKNLRGVLYGLA